jgi:hypothetical protein
MDVEGNKTIDNLNITFVPAAIYAYNIGVLTLVQKSNWLDPSGG